MKQSIFKNWAELVRFPNLFTVPGDILLGMAAVSSVAGFSLGKYLYVLIISLLLYAGGMILNDVMDYDEDKKLRSKRVLPSGRISLDAAKISVVICFALAAIMAHFFNQSVFVITIILILCVYFYDGPSRRIPQLGFVSMGACRSLNILLGAVAISEVNTPALVVALCEGAYIYAVCVIAHNETSKLPSQAWCKLPLTVIAVSLVIIIFSTPFNIFSLAAALFLLWSTFNIVKDLNETLPVSKIPPNIGRLIRNLIPLQFCLAITVAPHWLYILLPLMLAIPLCAKSAKKVTMS